MTSPEDMIARASMFFNTEPSVETLPDKFNTEEEAVQCFINSLLFEANRSMKEKIDFPDRPIMNAVDLESNEPGIIEGINGTNVQIARSNCNDIPNVVYKRNKLHSVDESKPTKITEKRIEKLLESATEQKDRSFEREQKREVNKASAKRTRREKKQNESATEDLHAALNGSELPEDPPDNSPNEVPVEEQSMNEPCEKENVTKKDKVKKEKKKVAPIELDIDCSVPSDSVKRKKTDKNNLSVYESPVPHDRHLTALTNCSVHEKILPTLLHAKASPNVVAVEGPPGTGKTTYLLNEVQSFIKRNPNLRIAICSPTNANAADLFYRALNMGIVGFLGLSKENIPKGIPKTLLVDEKKAKVIFCTISGRNGAKLKYQRIHAIFIDEAAMVPEALTWGLLREEVEYLFMVGDTKQLPAMVSKEGESLCHNRSMLERLKENGFHVKMLSEQRRMHPEILMFPNQHFYDNKLSTYRNRENKTFDFEPYQVIHVDGEEERVGTSFKNSKESILCVDIAKQMNTIGLKVHIIVPYTAQMNEILSLGSGIPVSTIDSFQGKEEDIIVVSKVRTSGDGFWSDTRRLCVALTRARHILRIVGDFSKGDSNFNMIVEDAKKRKVYINE